MRSTFSARLSKVLSTLCAAVLCCGLIPTAAFAAPDSLSLIPEGEQGAVPIVTSGAEEVGDDVLALRSDEASSADGDGAVTSSENAYDMTDETVDTDSAVPIDDGIAAIPAATQRVNEDVTLTTRTVAQAESTRSYFLAQTLESTRTVPIVSANLPLDMTVSEPQGPKADAPASSEGEEGEGSDDPDPAAGSNAIAAESVVVGSFEYRGITYAVEPGGESVAVVAADYSKLPSEFIEAQAIVLPSMVTSDGIDYYSVTRIADNAFMGLSFRHVISSGVGEADTVEKSALIEQNEGEALASSREDATASDDETVGIVAITIPASIIEIGDDAFTGFDTLRYVIVSEDNPNYGMYDGCLYDADLTRLLLIPEGRLGAVCIAPSVETIDPEVFSHTGITEVAADADSAAFPLLEEMLNGQIPESMGLLVSNELSETTLFDVKTVWRVIELEDADTSWRNQLITDIESQEGIVCDKLTCSWDDASVPESGSALCTLKDESGSHYVFAELSIAAPSYEPTLLVEERLRSDATYSNTKGWFIGIPPYSKIWERKAPGSTYTGTLLSSTYKPTTNDTATARWVETGNTFGGMRTSGNGHTIYTTSIGRNTDANIWSELVVTPYTIPSLSQEDISKYSYKSDLFWMANTGPTNKVPITSSYNAPGDGLERPYAYFQSYVAVTFYQGDKGSFKRGVDWDCYVSDAVIGAPATLVSASRNIYTEMQSNLNVPQDYAFVGWATSASVSPTSTNAADWWYRVGKPELTHATSGSEWSQKLYAIYQQCYLVSFDGVSGTNVQESFYAYDGDIKKLKDAVAIPSRSGYKFDGYYEQRADGSRNFWYGADGKLRTPNNGDSYGTYPLRSNITLYAQWSRDIVLDAQGLAPDQTINVVWGKSLPSTLKDISAVIPAPRATGYKFTGYWSTPSWNAHPETDRYYVKTEEIAIPVAERTWDIDQDRLYAHWTYKIVFNLNTYDGYGNVAVNAGKFEASIPSTSYVSTETIEIENGKRVEVYTLFANVGASFTLPSVTRAGYRNTSKWNSAAPQGRTAMSGTLFSFRPGSDLTTTSANVGGFDSMALVLLADWTDLAETYTVTLKNTYDHGSDSFKAAPDSITINARYDAPLLKTKDGKVVTYADEKEVAAPVVKNADGTYRYVFCGYRDAENGLDMADGASDWNGAEYIGAQAITGASGYAGSSLVPTSTLFRTPNNGLELYALWNRVESKLTLDLQGGSLGSMSGAIEVPDFKLTANEDVIELPGAYAQVPVREGYRFKGYYTKATDTDAAYATYAETATVKAYYKKNGSGVSAESAKWPFYANTVLYAHWEYDIECALIHEDDCASNPDGQHTVTGMKSGFADGDTTDVYGNSYPESGTFGTEDAPYTITALAGVPVKLPHAQNRNGYSDTDSWKRGSGTAHANASSGYTASAADTLFGAPSATDGKIVLRADWSDAVHTYTVNLVADYDGYAPDNDYATVMEDVVYGEPFLEAGESLVAPHIAGYRFMGYFTDKNGAGEAYTEATDNSNKGQVGCLRTNGSPKPFTAASLVNGDEIDLYASYERLEYTVLFNTDAVQPADASKVPSVVSGLSSTPFSASELASYQGRLEANKHQATDLSEGFAASSLKLHYGDALAGEHALPTPALENGRTATFWCQGYTFCGWYSFPIEEDGTLNVVYTEDGMVDLKVSGAVRFKAGSYGSSHPVSKELASFDVEIADVENPTMTLYAVWERNAYAITWDETSSLSTSSVTAPTQLAYQIALYGSKVERANPVFRDHVFAGTWHASAACTGAAVVLDPYRPSASSSSSPVYFAKWDGTEEHAVYFYPGAHGSFEGAAYLEAPYLYADAASVPFGPYSQVLSRDAGYAFAGWREAANAEDAEAGIVKDGSSTPINSLSGVAGFSTRTDDIYLVAQYSARTYVIRLDANGGTELDPSSIEFKEADEGPILLPGATEMKLPGSTFVGWEDESGDLLATDAASGITVNPDGSASIDPHLYVFAMKDPTVLEIPLRAKWKENAYVVRFNLWKDGSGSASSTAAVSDVLEVPVLFGGTFEMPYPAAAAGSKRVFSHWGTSASTTRPDTVHTSWVPEAKVLFDADFLATLKTAPVYEVDADRYVLDLYAEFGRAISATLPTSASVHVDPHNPGAMIVTDTAISSDLLDEDDTALPVRVVSLSYNAITGDGTQPGTRGAFAGSNGADASKVKLAVYAKVEDDSFKGFTDELRDAEFVRTSIVPNSTVRFALGDTTDVRTLTDLEQGGFAPFSKGKRLHIVYSLAFEDGYDESDFVTSLPDANIVGSDGKSRDKYDIARVCYTIGYAPKTS